MVKQLQQMEQTLPPTVSTVPVAQDESELHTVEASQCLEWLNGSEGQKFKYSTRSSVQHMRMFISTGKNMSLKPRKLLQLMLRRLNRNPFGVYIRCGR